MGQLKPHPTQEGVKIHYEDREGNEYDEVHGDPEQNLEVTTVAEKEGKLQPNEIGTTPDPVDPELTAEEMARREEVEEATAPGGEGEDDTNNEKKDTKQGTKPNDKSATSSGNKDGGEVAGGVQPPSSPPA
jgi:hypothetical protein